MSLSNFVKRVRNIMRNDAGINGDEILPPAELLADYFKKRKALDHEILRDTSDSIYHSFLMKKYDFVLFNERNEEKQLLLILPHIQNLRN